jgi:hypothetical protein
VGLFCFRPQASFAFGTFPVSTTLRLDLFATPIRFRLRLLLPTDRGIQLDDVAR